MAKRTKYLIGALLLGLGLFFPATVSYAEDDVELVIDLSTSPESVLFEVENAKPGDWAVKTLTVENSGTVDFTYTAYAGLQTGSEELFDALLLDIQAGDEEVYSGPLAGLGFLSERALAAGESEEITVTITMPESLGNEYQDLAALFGLTLQATGEADSGEGTVPGNDDEPGDEPGDGPGEEPDQEPGAKTDDNRDADGVTPVPMPVSSDGEGNGGGDATDGVSVLSAGQSGEALPDTSTNMYRYLIAGAMLIAGGGVLFFLQRKRQDVH